MTVYTDNPAGRLHLLLSDLLARPDGQSNPTAWEELFRLPPVGSDAELARCMSQIVQLPAEIEAELGQIGDELYDRDLVMRWKEPVQDTLAGAFFVTAQVSSIRKFGRADLTSLEAATTCCTGTGRNG